MESFKHYLTSKELKIIELMKKGEPIAGKETTDNAIKVFIKSCIVEKVKNN